MFSLIRNSAAFEQLPYETFTRPYCYTRCIIKRSEILLALLMKLDSASLRAGLLCCLNFQTGWEKYLFTGCPPGWMPNKFTPGAGAFGRPFRTKRERERERERERKVPTVYDVSAFLLARFLFIISENRYRHLGG